MSDIAIRVEGLGKRYRLGERAPYKTLRETIARGAAHDFRYALDRAKIRGELGWRPQVGFEEGLQRTVEWYLQNPEWVESVVTGEYREYYEKVYGVG